MSDACLCQTTGRKRVIMFRPEAGEVLEAVATDPGSVPDFKAWSTSTGNELIEQTEEEGGVFRFLIRKR